MLLQIRATVVTRASVVRPSVRKTQFSQKPSSELISNLGKTICPYLKTIFCCSKFYLFLRIVLALLCATAQESYCRHAGVRSPSVRRPSLKPVCSETVKQIKIKFWEKLPVHHHISRLFFFVFQNLQFNVNMGPYGRQKFQKPSPLKVHNRFTPKIECILLGGGLYQTCSKNCEILPFFMFVTIGPHGSESFKQHLLWKYAPDLLPKFVNTLGEGVYESFWNNCEIWYFEFLANFWFFFFGRLTW